MSIGRARKVKKFLLVRIGGSIMILVVPRIRKMLGLGGAETVWTVDISEEKVGRLTR